MWVAGRATGHCMHKVHPHCRPMIWAGCSNSTAKQALDMHCLVCAADLMPFVFVLNDESCHSSHALWRKHRGPASTAVRCLYAPACCCWTSKERKPSTATAALQQEGFWQHRTGAHEQHAGIAAGTGCWQRGALCTTQGSVHCSV